MLKIVLVILAAIAALVLVIVLVGSRLPVKHVASRSAEFKAPPDSLFAVIADFRNAPSWRKELKSVELLAPVNGRVRFREVGGERPLTMEVEELSAPRRLVTRIADTGLPFGGSWEFELEPAGHGTRLTITEHGEVYNPVFRFMSRFVIGTTGTIDKYLASLTRREG